MRARARLQRTPVVFTIRMVYPLRSLRSLSLFHPFGVTAKRRRIPRKHTVFINPGAAIAYDGLIIMSLDAVYENDSRNGDARCHARAWSM